MDTNTVNPEAPNDTPPPGYGPERPAQERPAPERSAPERSALRRSYSDRMLAGVAAGLARYFDVDVTIVRIAFVVLTIVGGAGIPLYLAGLLLIPEEGSDQSIAGSIIESLQNRPR
jgi:phage shock protein PspC (stress-responsive transcriptional regulator)